MEFMFIVTKMVKVSPELTGTLDCKKKQSRKMEKGIWASEKLQVKWEEQTSEPSFKRRSSGHSFLKIGTGEFVRNL